MMTADVARAERERIASNEGEVYARNAEVRGRFSHVTEGPNSQYAEARYHRLLADAARGKRVLDFGCGMGHLGRTLVKLGAAHVHGIDISDVFIAEAKRLAGDDPRLSYAVADAALFKGETYDVITGHAILHHLDWRTVVKHLYDNVLAPGGTMFFYEPLGENLGLRMYWKFFPKAHTEDETPFFRKDVAWWRKTFPGFEFHVTNYASFYLGVASSFVLKDPNNPVMKAADQLDRAIEKLEFMKPAFRYGLFTVKKPA
jgi:SAM-dependent methyltransferase